MAFPRGQADAQLGRGGEHRVLVVRRSHVEGRGGAAGEQLGDPQARGRRDLRGLERRLVRPDALGQPAQERQPLGAVPGQTLDDVDVSLHEPREHERIGGVKHVAAGLGVEAGGNGGDAAILDPHVGLKLDPAFSHRDDRTASHEHRAPQAHRDSILAVGPVTVKSRTGEGLPGTIPPNPGRSAGDGKAPGPDADGYTPCVRGGIRLGLGHLVAFVAVALVLNAQFTWWVYHSLRENRERLDLERGLLAARVEGAALRLAARLEDAKRRVSELPTGVIPSPVPPFVEVQVVDAAALPLPRAGEDAATAMRWVTVDGRPAFARPLGRGRIALSFPRCRRRPTAGSRRSTRRCSLSSATRSSRAARRPPSVRRSISSW